MCLYFVFMYSLNLLKLKSGVYETPIASPEDFSPELAQQLQTFV
ncbi:unnamed protein product, partial [Larinioides sclopetarius]